MSARWSSSSGEVPCDAASRRPAVRIRRGLQRALWWLATGALYLACVTPAGAQERDLALAIEAEVQRIADDVPLWPGYDPLAIPLAVYTGSATYLFRHPAPPNGFSANASAQYFTQEGRHPAVTSNSSADIGGTMTATLLADGARSQSSPTALAAVALHEAFHVYQRAHHPTWQGNEGDLFLYPTEDARLLALRRLESLALSWALESEEPARRACWVRAALDYRAERFAAMDSVFVVYERRTELNEGLASYVQLVAAGERTVAIPEAEFPATAVRDRCYVIGPALAFLLDALAPDWQESLEANDSQFLDGMLAAAVARAAPSKSCAPSTVEVTAMEATAVRDAAAVVSARRDRREEFDARPGWRVVVESAAGQPLWPQGFDPLNVERVDGGILHTRFLQLGNDTGTMQALDEAGADLESLTEGAGAHPLFNGVKKSIVAGLAEPVIERSGKGVDLRAPGLTLHFDAARVTTRGQEVRIQVEATP